MRIIKRIANNKVYSKFSILLKFSKPLQKYLNLLGFFDHEVPQNILSLNFYGQGFGASAQKFGFVCDASVMRLL